MKGQKKSRGEALLCSIVAAIVLTGAVHALAINLPNWFSGRSSRQASPFEKTATHFSQMWLANAFVMAAAVALVCFLMVFSLLLWRVRASNRRDTGAG